MVCIKVSGLIYSKFSSRAETVSRTPAGINEDCYISSTVVNKNKTSGGLLGILDLEFKNGQLSQSS